MRFNFWGKRLSKRERQSVEGIRIRQGVLGFSEKIVPRITGGQEKLGTNVLRLYVERKKSRNELSETDLIPSKINGIETDVVEVGEIKATTTPLPPGGGLPDFRKAYQGYLWSGSSIGHKDVTAGTMGRIVMMGDLPLILSNNHVLADVTFAGVPGAKVGDVIYQPGPHDIITETDDLPNDFYLAGYLHEWAPLNRSDNLVDAALAIPTRPWYGYNQIGISGTGAITEIKKVVVGDRVKKSGRTTGVTTMQVLDTNANINIDFGAKGIIAFRDQLMFSGTDGKAGSAGGDSGSLIVWIDSAGRGWNVGLLFAASPTITLANKMSNVVKAFSQLLSLDVPSSGEPPDVTTPPPTEKTIYLGSRIYREVEVVAPAVAMKESRLSLSVPIKVETDETISIDGQLFDAETGLGIPNRTVDLGTQLVITDDGGVFSATLPGLSNPGVRIVRATFRGDDTDGG